MRLIDHHNRTSGWEAAKEHAREAAQKARRDVLRARVRLSLADMDETPCDPLAYAKAQQAAREFWIRWEQLPPTGRRKVVVGQRF